MAKKNLAFSLIELMVGIFVIAILAIIAIPNYRDYVIRARVAEVISLIQIDLKKITQWIDLNGIPTSIADGELIDAYVGNYVSKGSKYVNGVNFTLGDGWGLFIRINNGALAGYDIRLRYLPSLRNGLVLWHCGYGSATPVNSIKYLPDSCNKLISDYATLGYPKLW